MRKNPFPALLLSLATGCGGGLRLVQVHHTIEKPAKLVTLWKIEAADGPVADLPREAITLVEDERRVGDKEWDFANPDLSDRHHTLLLVDLGGNPTPAEKTALATAAELLMSRVSRNAVVAIYGFDGAASPHVLVPFAAPDSGKARKAIEGFQSKDSSTDLHGAYRAAFEALDRQLAGGPLRTGTLVLLSRGPDRAARVELSQVNERVEKAEGKIARQALGIGNTELASSIAPFCDDRPTVVANADELGTIMVGVADAIIARGRSFYLLSYCSAARAGTHTLGIEAKRTVKGKTEPETQTGSASLAFDASGFGAGCNPSIPAEWRKRAPAIDELPNKPPPANPPQEK
jgi:hypothetical protein